MARYVDVEPIISDTVAMKRIYTAIDIDGIVKRLEEAPTADVKPAVRGEFNQMDYPYSPKLVRYTCSNCGFEKGLHGKYNFCPSCGADMRGENNGDN